MNMDSNKLKKWLEAEIEKKKGLLIEIGYDMRSHEYNEGFYEGFKAVYDSIDWEKYTNPPTDLDKWKAFLDEMGIKYHIQEFSWDTLVKNQLQIVTGKQAMPSWEINFDSDGRMIK